MTRLILAAALALPLPALAGGWAGGPPGSPGFNGGSAFDEISQPDRDRRRDGPSYGGHRVADRGCGDNKALCPRGTLRYGEVTVPPITEPFTPVVDKPHKPTTTGVTPEPDTPSPIPLPAGLGLLAMGLSGLAFVRRRR